MHQAAPYPHKVNATAELNELFTENRISPLNNFHNFVRQHCQTHSLNVNCVMKNGRDLYSLFCNDMHGVIHPNERLFLRESFQSAEKLAAITLACDYFGLDYKYQPDAKSSDTTQGPAF
jgi:hypothetical protein